MISSLYLSFYQNIAIHKRELWSLGGLFIHILRRIFYVFKNTHNKDTKFRVYFFWYSVAEGEFIEQEGTRRDYR